MNKKRRVRISSQRQITIPIDFYSEMNLSDEAMIEFTGNEIIIRSAEQEIVDFSTDILKSLVAQGVSGDDLIREFERIKKSIPDALGAMVSEAMEQPRLTGSLDEYLDSLKEEDDE